MGEILVEPESDDEVDTDGENDDLNEVDQLLSDFNTISITKYANKRTNMRCFAHFLQLVVKNSLNHVKGLRKVLAKC